MKWRSLPVAPRVAAFAVRVPTGITARTCGSLALEEYDQVELYAVPEPLGDQSSTSKLPESPAMSEP